MQENFYALAVFAWVPEHIIYGKPCIIGVWVDDIMNVAISRDNHYSNPPNYIVREPEDTSNRTRNLQMSNCNGLIIQETGEKLEEAIEFSDAIGIRKQGYNLDEIFQSKLKESQQRYKYRLDTNFAKIDRIEHKSLHNFKVKIGKQKLHDRQISEWTKVFRKGSRNEIEAAFDMLTSLDIV